MPVWCLQPHKAHIFLEEFPCARGSHEAEVSLAADDVVSLE